MIFDFGLDLWIDLIILNDLCDQDIFNLGITCKFFSQLFKRERIIQFVEDHKFYFGKYPADKPHALAWSPDSRTLAIGDEAGQIVIWKTGKIQQVFQMPQETPQNNESSASVEALAFHPQNSSLFAASYDNGWLYLWDRAKSKIKFKFDFNDEEKVLAMAFDPTGQFLATCSWENGRVWNAETGKVHIELAKHCFWSVAFSSDGQYLAGATEFWTIFVWDAKTFQLTREIPLPRQKIANSSKNFIQFLNDNKTLVFVNQNNQVVKFFDVEQGSENTEMRFEANRTSYLQASLDSNQDILAVGNHKGFQIWDINAKKTLEENDEPLYLLSFSPNGRALAVSGMSQFSIFDMKRFWKINK